MSNAKFFFQSGTMGFNGKGYLWHGLFNFNTDNIPIVTKTITLNPKKGQPYLIIPLGNSVYNRVGLHNFGLYEWIRKHHNKELILSIAGSDKEIKEIISILEYLKLELNGIELNYSCPNIKSNQNKIIPHTKYNLYLKLRYNQDPYKFDLNNIKSIRLNSVPANGLHKGGLSGKLAQSKNWSFIKQFGNELNVSGCSFNNMDDINKLIDMGCKEIGIGSVILTNPFFVKQLLNREQNLNR